MSKHDRTEFRLEGRFLGFVAKEGYKLKYLRLSTTASEQVIKLPKESRLSLYRTLTPGTWVQVTGSRKIDLDSGSVKLKAYEVTPTVPTAQPSSIAPAAVQANVQANVQAKPARETILVCQKSDCCKRGGRALFQSLQAELDDRGLSDRVTLKPTGCMKHCKAGPNLVMPDKTRYSQIRANAVPALLDRHFPTPAPVK